MPSMAVEVIEQNATEGLQYLCTKYSSLITRLREEVLARQEREAEVQKVESRLREAAVLQNAERAQWEEERRGLREQIAALIRLQHNTAGRRVAETADLRHAATANAQLFARCDQLHNQCVEEAHKTLQVIDEASAGKEALSKKNDELIRLQHEFSELKLQHQDACEELETCQEYAAQLRTTVLDLEMQLKAITKSRDDAELRSNRFQDEMRAALRSAAAARGREREVADVLNRGERELRSYEERLSAVRHEGQKHARRATSAERRLGTCETAEETARQLKTEMIDLKERLEHESRACEAAHLGFAKAEAVEARAVASAYAAKSEIWTRDKLQQSSKLHLEQMETELASARTEVQELEAGRRDNLLAIENLWGELRVERRARDEEWRQGERITNELSSAKRRLETLRAKEKLHQGSATRLTRPSSAEEPPRRPPSKWPSQPLLRGVRSTSGLASAPTLRTRKAETRPAPARRLNSRLPLGTPTVPVSRLDERALQGAGANDVAVSDQRCSWESWVDSSQPEPAGLQPRPPPPQAPPLEGPMSLLAIEPRVLQLPDRVKEPFGGNNGRGGQLAY